MKQHGRRRTARRNIMFVLLCFLLVGALAVVARVHQSTANFLAPESEEVKAFRLDRDRNAFYTLQKALELMPVPPPELYSATGPGTGPQLAGVSMHQPPEGSLGEMLAVARPDDEVLLAYIRDCRPAFDKAREALNKTDLMFPMLESAGENVPSGVANYGMFRHMLRHFIATARIQAAAPEPIMEVTTLFRDVLRLEQRINCDTPAIKEYVAKDLSPLLSRMSPRQLRQTLDWLTLFRRQIEPPYRFAESALRDFMAHKEDVDWKYIIDHPVRTVVYLVNRARAKALLRRHYKDYMTAAGLEFYRLREFEREHHPLADLGKAEGLLGYETLSRIYSGRLAEHDGLTLAAAIELYRREHQEYPESLDPVAQYLPSMPVDPLSGKPFNYARQGDDYALFSKEPAGDGKVIIHAQPEEPDVPPREVRPQPNPFARLKSRRGTG